MISPVLSGFKWHKNRDLPLGTTAPLNEEEGYSSSEFGSNSLLFLANASDIMGFPDCWCTKVQMQGNGWLMHHSLSIRDSLSWPSNELEGFSRAISVCAIMLTSRCLAVVNLGWRKPEKKSNKLTANWWYFKFWQSSPICLLILTFHSSQTAVLCICPCFIGSFSERERSVLTLSHLELEMLQYNLNRSDNITYFCIVSEIKENFQLFSIFC